LRELVVSEPQVEFVEPQGLTVNFPSIGAPMVVRAKGDEVVVLVRLTVRPRDNVMDIDFDVSASGDGAPMTCLDKDTPSDLSRYWRTSVAICIGHYGSPCFGGL
jgi:hypothetical protein